MCSDSPSVQQQYLSLSYTYSTQDELLKSLQATADVFMLVPCWKSLHFR